MTAEGYERAAALREALRTFERQSEETTRRHGLTVRGYSLLLMIATGRELPGRAGPDELERRLRLAKSTIAELLQRNEALGLVRRTRHPRRPGGIVLSLTPKGERVLRAVFDELGAERERLLELLRDLEPGRPAAT
jgi:DNA-binding MarR family transcriptional regulator